jgi:hypothetical protein
MYIQVHNKDSGERGWGDLLIPIPIFYSEDQNSPYIFPNRGIPHGFAGSEAPLHSDTGDAAAWVMLLGAFSRQRAWRRALVAVASMTPSSGWRAAHQL